MATESKRGMGWKVAGLLLGGVGIAQIVVAIVLLLRHGDPHSWAEESLWFPFVVGGVGAIELILGFVLFGRGAAVDRTSPLTFLLPDEEAKVVEAIGRFEQRTSGELRVHLERHIEGDILEGGKKIFEQIGLTATRERNGVMFLVALKDHRFAVLGDQGIDQKVPPGFWTEVVAKVQKRFAEGAFATGLVEGVELAGEQLATHFPPRADDKNELPDHISRGPSH
jgi:hypothetical protein